jgi:hypothetical protein
LFFHFTSVRRKCSIGVRSGHIAYLYMSVSTIHQVFTKPKDNFQGFPTKPISKHVKSPARCAVRVNFPLAKNAVAFACCINNLCLDRFDVVEAVGC